MAVNVQRSDLYVGMFLVATVALVVVALIATSGWGVDRYDVFVRTDNAQDIAVDTKIYMQGLEVGRVAAIAPAARRHRGPPRVHPPPVAGGPLPRRHAAAAAARHRRRGHLGAARRLPAPAHRPVRQRRHARARRHHRDAARHVAPGGLRRPGARPQGHHRARARLGHRHDGHGARAGRQPAARDRHGAAPPDRDPAGGREDPGRRERQPRPPADPARQHQHAHRAHLPPGGRDARPVARAARQRGLPDPTP